ncbi:MAG: DUF305 domain-containing protein [Pyrinomonadaceae bacterium]
MTFAIVALPQSVQAQTSEGEPPAVVRPGAPGHATKKLPASTRASLPPESRKDIEFMQGMIMHHAQAVEMTDLIESRTENSDIRRLGSKISGSQADEMKFMARWLELRSQPISMPMPKGHLHSGAIEMMMPGMLTAEQMLALKNSTGIEFERLFLEGMIQHHEGALTMVKDLFESPGTGQDAELFNFASDVDTGQRAEIKIMQNLLSKMRVEKKP